jgi:DNA ligase-1
MITLYRNHVGSIGTWRIWNDKARIFIAHATVEGGSEVRHTEDVVTNQSGRSIDEQIALRIRSRISRMRDRGYKDTRDEALRSTGNQLGLARPMLAQPLGKVSSINYRNAVLQRKLDGHRCLITNDNGTLIAYSRQGKLIESIDHIMNDLQDLIPEGTTIDGELYCHNVPLQTIGSWIKRKQDNTKKLWYVVYDLLSDDNFQDRYSELKSITDNLDKSSPVKLLPCIPYTNDSALWDYFHESKAKGFEGLILRTNDKPYQDGVRSASLIKIKEFIDTEVLVKDIVPSKEGWGICICEFEGKEFRTSAPGTFEEKQEALDNKRNYIGKMLTIEYSMLTNDGIPFHASAIRWYETI